MHLTNYSINKTNTADYINPTDEEVLLDNQGSKRTFASLWDTLNSDEREIDVEQIQEDIAEVCGKIIQIYGPMIEHNVTCINNKMELGGKPFQVMGLDVLIDENQKVWILEINGNPSLSIYYDDSAGMEHKKHTEEDVNLTDLYVNSQVVQDAIMLAKKSRASLDETEEYGSLSKVHPNEQATVYHNLVGLRQLFYDLAPIKNKTSITMQSFEKLASKTVLKAQNISKHDLQQVFSQKTMGAKFIDLLAFIKLVACLYEIKVDKT